MGDEFLEYRVYIRKPGEVWVETRAGEDLLSGGGGGRFRLETSEDDWTRNTVSVGG